jgi:hypothetical protein
MSVACKICSSPTQKLFNKKVLGKYPTDYYQCTHCGFLQIVDHPWLSEAYTSAITTLDIGLIQRNLDYAPKIMALIDHVIKSNNRFLDYGGGYGLFVRLMRDKGYDYFRYDKYCENLFADYFDYDIEEKKQAFDLVTAFEVFEHIPDPRHELETMMQLSDNLFFSTELLPQKKEDIQNWWYISPEIGQHISFYSRESLALLAKSYGFYYHTDGKFFHFFTKKKINPALFNMLTQRRVSKLLQLVKRKKSLLQDDYDMILNKIRPANIEQ